MTNATEGGKPDRYQPILDTYRGLKVDVEGTLSAMQRAYTATMPSQALSTLDLVELLDTVERAKKERDPLRALQRISQLEGTVRSHLGGQIGFLERNSVMPATKLARQGMVRDGVDYLADAMGFTGEE